MDRFRAGDLNRDFVAVAPYQGPKANGMPELHKLTPPLGVLQDKGFKIALVTDGRMSGASGKVPAAIHLSPEALDGGAIARIRDGDIICLDAEAGTLTLRVDAATLKSRAPAGTSIFGSSMASTSFPVNGRPKLLLPRCRPFASVRPPVSSRNSREKLLWLSIPPKLNPGASKSFFHGVPKVKSFGAGLVQGSPKA